MGIGAYRHLVTLEHPSGVVVPTTWYCSMQPGATAAGDGLAAFFIRGRYHPGITLETQINWEGRTFQVQGIADLDERHKELQITAVEVVGRGKALDQRPYITEQPIGTMMLGESSWLLEVEAGGTPPLTYQWMANGVIIPGATGHSYETGPLAATTVFSVRVSNAYGFVTSSGATVTIVYVPVILEQPEDVEVTPGSSATLTVVADGTPPLAYQWMTVAMPSPLLDGLVSYWALGESTGVRADSHGTNHLTPTNNPIGAAGKVGGACDFESSSSQYLSHADPTPLGDEDWTYSFWFKQETWSSPNVLITRSDGSTGQYTYKFVSSGRLFLNLNNDALNCFTLALTQDTDWHFVVGWHDAAANTLNIQMDNADVGTIGTSGAVPDPFSAPVSIGRGFHDAATRYFDGLIDDVALWRRVLTPAERTALYNAGNGIAYPFAGVTP